MTSKSLGVRILHLPSWLPYDMSIEDANRHCCCAHHELIETTQDYLPGIDAEPPSNFTTGHMRFSV